MTEESAGDLLARLGMDGRLWAEEFHKTAQRLGYQPMDEGWLIGWFANAIMAGYDHAARPVAQVQAELCEDEGCDHYGIPHVCINNKPTQVQAEAVAGAYLAAAGKCYPWSIACAEEIEALTPADASAALARRDAETRDPLEKQIAELTARAEAAEAKVARLAEAVTPLKDIADAYDANELDDEARKFWGRNDEFFNSTAPEEIELYQGRGGRRLLALSDALNARAALAGIEGTA